MFVAVLSDNPELRESFCKSVGKEVSKDGLGLYSADANNKIWLIDPIHYPEKIQPLLYSLSMADFVVLLVDKLTPKIGELIVAINSLNLDQGIIVSSSNLPVSGTVLEKYDKVTNNEAAKAKILATTITSTKEDPLGLIHRTANMPSMGNVAYGALKGGKVRKQDKLFLLPDGKDIEIRSVRVDGKDAEEISANSSFEISYKGDLIEHGLLASLRHGFEVEKIVKGRFSQSPFYKDELNPRVHVYANMQYLEGQITENDITLNKPMAFKKGQSILIIDASNQKLRIAGVFQSKW
ncbi:MAG: hypothetical protein ABII22_07070 [Candidatus Micrarchaeota archaeon]